MFLNLNEEKTIVIKTLTFYLRGFVGGGWGKCVNYKLIRLDTDWTAVELNRNHQLVDGVHGSIKSIELGPVNWLRHIRIALTGGPEMAFTGAICSREKQTQKARPAGNQTANGK